MKFKVCGMKYPENILEVSQSLPNFMGFIFWKQSARYFEGDIPNLPKTIKKVGVFVDENLEKVISTIEKHQLDVVQLHGNEPVDYCKKLKEQHIEIIKVFSVADNFDFDILKDFEPFINYFLFDTKGKLPGGNGLAFDWKILKNYKSEIPLFLSGGIGIEDIESIKNLDLPIYGIDVNSRFETQPGLKNIDLIQQLKSKL